MKNKILLKLILYFTSALLLFSLIIGIVFISLFRKHTMDIQKADLETRAVTMAKTLSELMPSESSNSMGGKQNGYGMYIKFLDDIAMTDVWIVNEELGLVTSGHMSLKQYHYADLPEDAEAVVKKVFEGQTTFSEGFSTLLNTSALTVGTPIYSNEKIIGALLLHSPIEGMQEGISQGFSILLISIITALILAIILSVLLAVAFTKPLKKMQHSALQLANGNYNVKTGIRQNDEIGELASAIDILSERLDVSSRQSAQLQKLRQDFIANISHELRTPITVIRGSLEALNDEVVTIPEQVKSYYKQMLYDSIHLQRLVDDLLDLSRLQNVDFKVEMKQISLCDVLFDAVRSVNQMALDKNIKIDIKKIDPICTIMGDYGRLRQMFLILLDNAIKFSPPNYEVNIIMKNKTIIIKDNGIGISEEDLPYIFDRFYKVNSSENKNGTGLGLAIAKQIADRHNLSITVNSTPNIGTEFIFELTQ